MSRRNRVVVGLMGLGVVLLLALLLVSWWSPEAGGGGAGDAGVVDAQEIVRGQGAGARGLDPAARDFEGPSVARGVVKDAARSRMVSGARLVVRGAPSRRGGVPFAESVSNEDGTFEVPCAKGAYLQVRARGYEVDESALPCKDGVEVVLDPGAVVEGRVILATSQAPVAGARVGCMRKGGIQPLDETESRSDGTFALENCIAVDLQVTASHPSGTTAWQVLGTRSPGGVVTGVVLELGDSRLLSGRVVDAGGGPVAGAQVAALENGDWSRPTLVLTDEKGAFEIGVGFTKHLVGALAADGRVVTRDISAGREDVPPFDLQLPAGHVMRGRLVGDLTDARVHASRASEDIKEGEAASFREQLWGRLQRGIFLRWATIDGDRFAFEGLEPGRYALRATSRRSKGTATAEHDATDVVIELEPETSVSMNIAWDDGTPAAGMARVQFEANGVGMFMPVRNGLLEMRSAPVAGDATVTFRPPEGPVPAPTVIHLEEGEQHDLTWTLSRTSNRISGRVVDPDDQPVAGAQVSVAVDILGKQWRRGDPFVLTGADGIFSMEVSSLQDPLFVLAPGYASVVVPAADSSTVRLTPGASGSVVPQRPPTGDAKRKAAATKGGDSAVFGAAAAR